MLQQNLENSMAKLCHKCDGSRKYTRVGINIGARHLKQKKQSTCITHKIGVNGIFMLAIQRKIPRKLSTGRNRLEIVIGNLSYKRLRNTITEIRNRRI